MCSFGRFFRPEDRFRLRGQTVRQEAELEVVASGDAHGIVAAWTRVLAAVMETGVGRVRTDRVSKG